MSDAIGLEKVMTFDEWIRQECFRAPPEYAVELAKSAWDYQQARIEALTLNIDALCMELLDKDKRIEALEKAARDVVERHKRIITKDHAHYGPQKFVDYASDEARALAALLEAEK